MNKCMQHVDYAHLNSSADRPPFHTPGKVIVHIRINRESVGEERQSANRNFSRQSRSGCVTVPGTRFEINISWNICWTDNVNMPDEACPDTHHIERHDDHKVDADTSARGGKLPVLLQKLPVEGSKLLHRDETENHHSKNSRQNQGNLSRGDGEGSAGEGMMDEVENWVIRNLLGLQFGLQMFFST